jgi:hypothetical protein
MGGVSLPFFRLAAKTGCTRDGMAPALARQTPVDKLGSE